MIDVAKELAGFFIDNNLSPTDLMAGLILVKRRQKIEAEIELEVRVESVLAVVEYESQSIAELSRSTDYLVLPSSSDSPPSSPVLELDVTLERDDIPDILHFAKYMAVMYNEFPENSKFLGRILHISKENDVFQSPYLVAVDEEWRTVS
jgi:hypothetical protein